MSRTRPTRHYVCETHLHITNHSHVYWMKMLSIYKSKFIPWWFPYSNVSAVNRSNSIRRILGECLPVQLHNREILYIWASSGLGHPKWLAWRGSGMIVKYLTCHPAPSETLLLPRTRAWWGLDLTLARQDFSQPPSVRLTQFSTEIQEDHSW